MQSSLRPVFAPCRTEFEESFTVSGIRPRSQTKRNDSEDEKSKKEITV